MKQENAVLTTAEQTSAAEWQRDFDARIAVRAVKEKFFTAARVAQIAVLSALAYLVTFIEFPVFPAADFLKLDFANVFVLMGGFMYGPLTALTISGVKELLSLLDTKTAGIGELANFILTFSFVIIPTFVYRYKKGIKTVIATLSAGTVVLVGASLLTNRYINFPLYEKFLGMSAAEAFGLMWWYVALFNLIKGVAVSLVTVLIYKRVSFLLKKI